MEVYEVITDCGEYVGEINVNNLPHGKGKFTLANGDVYEGNFANGDPHGNVKVTLSNGTIYEGEFANDSPNGKVIFGERVDKLQWKLCS